MRGASSAAKSCFAGCDPGHRVCGTSLSHHRKPHSLSAKSEPLCIRQVISTLPVDQEIHLDGFGAWCPDRLFGNNQGV